MSHRDRRLSPGVERAWVHPVMAAKAGGQWAKDATFVIPAYYDAEADGTRTTGEPIPFTQFQAST